MTDRAKMVNNALDAAVPLKYPEDLTESMRCVDNTGHEGEADSGLIPIVALSQVLPAGGRKEGQARPLPGSLRPRWWQHRRRHAHRLRDGDGPHHVAHPRRPARHGQR